MKKCPVCGKEWSDATRFCGSCGAKLEDGNIVVPDIVPDDGKEMQKKRKEGEAKIKSILTDEQYKKYQDMRKKENADRKKRTK